MTGMTIAVVAPGDMGHGVGRALRDHGHEVLTCLAGRSARSRNLAEAAGMTDAGDMTALVSAADLFLSILPPASALDLARETAAAMAAANSFPTYVDCNAVSPGTAKQVAAVIADAGAPVIDAGIIGPSPNKGRPRFYVSGPDMAAMQALDGCGFVVRPAGADIGQASAVKMCYAALTKGTFSLDTAILMAAKASGAYDTLMTEFEGSQGATLDKMKGRVPFLPADAGRWIGEMEEIAATFREAGVTGDFHDGAAWIMRVLADTPFATETRETLDRSRGLDDVLDVYLKHTGAGDPKA